MTEVADLAGLTELGVERMQVVQLQPGDVIVVTVGRGMNQAEVAAVRLALQSKFGHDASILILGAGSDLKVYRP